MQKLIEFNENQETPLYLPSHLEDLKHKSEYFEVPDLETRIQTHDNPHYWLQQERLQVKNFQYRFFNNITLTDDTIPHVKIFTHVEKSFLGLTINCCENNRISKLTLNFLKYYQKLNSYHTSLKMKINIYSTDTLPRLIPLFFNRSIWIITL